MIIVNETDNMVFYKNRLGGISYRFKTQDESKIIEGVK